MNLVDLFLYNNHFSGPLPRFDTLLSLEKLFCSSNQLTGAVPSYQSSYRLSHLSVSRNRLTMLNPHTTPSFYGLVIYDVSYNNIGDEACDSLSSIFSEYVILAYNNMSCSLSFLKDVVKAQYLDLSGNSWAFSDKDDTLPYATLITLVGPLLRMCLSVCVCVCMR